MSLCPSQANDDDDDSKEIETPTRFEFDIPAVSVSLDVHQNHQGVMRTLIFSGQQHVRYDSGMKGCFDKVVSR